MQSTYCKESVAPFCFSILMDNMRKISEFMLFCSIKDYNDIILTLLILDYNCFTEPVPVRVHRTHLRDDLIKLFSTILQQTIEWKIIDDHGREEGVGAGVQRVIFTTFWQSVFCSYTLGDLEKVPCIRHDL